MNEKPRQIVYGPVASRRLGMSLGIDPSPPLTCTFSCVYCQLGRIRHVVSGPEQVEGKFPSPERIADAVRAKLEQTAHADVVSFSGSGEPTLHPALGEAIEAVRGVTTLPIALITNGSLLSRRDVFEAAVTCDLVLPSLDAGDQETFERINRPYRGISLDRIAEAIAELAERNSVWLEVMFVASAAGKTNVHPEAIDALVTRIDRIRPEDVSLNTCVRPPAEDLLALSDAQLVSIRDDMRRRLPGLSISVVPPLPANHRRAEGEKTLDEIAALLLVRPLTLLELAEASGVHLSEAGKLIGQLMARGSVSRRFQGGRLYYQLEERNRSA